MENFNFYSSSDHSDSDETSEESMQSMIVAYLCEAVLGNSDDHDTMENELQEVESQNCDNMNDLGLPMEDKDKDEPSEVSFLNPASSEMLSENMFNEATSTTWETFLPNSNNTDEAFRPFNFDRLRLPCRNDVELSSRLDAPREDLDSFIPQPACSCCVITPDSMESQTGISATMGTSQMVERDDEMGVIRFAGLKIVRPTQVNNDSVQTTANTQPGSSTDLSEMRTEEQPDRSYSVGQRDPEINQEDDKTEE